MTTPQARTTSHRRATRAPGPVENSLRSRGGACGRLAAGRPQGVTVAAGRLVGRQLDRSGVERAHADVLPGEALLDERRHADHQGGGDLDGLEDDPVGERVGRADVVGAG